MLWMRSLRSRRRTAGEAVPTRSRSGIRGTVARALAVGLPLLLMLAAPATAPARVANEGSSSAEAHTVSATPAAEERERRIQEREQRAAQKKAEAEEIRKIRKQEMRERLAQARARRQAEHNAKVGTRPAGSVAFSCSKLTYNFKGFPEGSTTTVTEIIHIDGTRLDPVKFTFTGPEGSNTVLISETEAPHRIDALAHWNTTRSDGSKGWDISAQETCAGKKSAPSFTIEKRQKIEGSGSGYVATPLTGEVGQKVLYEIVVTNNGNGNLTFTNFIDAVCDAGTITGPASTLVAPGSPVTYRCSHVITAADQAATPLTNVATITGTPSETGGVINGEPITETSNTVVVNIPPTKAPEKEKSGGGSSGGGSSGGGSSNQGSGTATGGSIGVLASSGSQSPRLEAIGEITSAPSLGGRPEGCVRSSFVVSIKAKNVKSVTFYLDGHRLKTLTAKSARKGRLSVRIQTSRLKPGVHRLKARITLVPNTASTKTITVTRSLKFARCASATVSPKFTG